MSLTEDESRSKSERQDQRKLPLEARRAGRPADRPSSTPSARAQIRLRRGRRLWLIGLVALLVTGAITAGVAWWLRSSGWVSTDDAFIDTHTVQVGPQVAGRVKSVLVNDNQKVRVGEPLVEIDAAPFQAALAQALANQQSAQGQLAQAKAQLSVAQANLDQAKAQVGVAQAAASNADITLKRDQTLAGMGYLAISRQQLDNDTASARSDRANLSAAQQKVSASSAQLTLNRAQIATADAGVRAAAAQLQQARLNLSYAEIRGIM